MERYILKKALVCLAKGAAVKYAFIARQSGVWPTRSTCRMLDVSASGFYEWLGRDPSARIAVIASMPLVSGSRKSISVTSGRIIRKRRIASSPVEVADDPHPDFVVDDAGDPLSHRLMIVDGADADGRRSMIAIPIAGQDFFTSPLSP